MCRLVAPTASRIPISRVRLVTACPMTAYMPTAATIKARVEKLPSVVAAVAPECGLDSDVHPTGQATAMEDWGRGRRRTPGGAHGGHPKRLGLGGVRHLERLQALLNRHTRQFPSPRLAANDTVASLGPDRLARTHSSGAPHWHECGAERAQQQHDQGADHVCSVSRARPVQDRVHAPQQ